MPTMDSIDPSLIFATFKGEPGTRKSTAALSFPGPQFWFSWDRKMNGLMIPMRNWGIDPKTIVYEDYDNWDKARVQLEKLQVTCPYKTLVFDSITTMADSTLRQVLKAKGKGGKKITTIEVNTVEDFNAESSAISELIALAKDIQAYHKVNIILIAHVIQVDYKSLNGETHVSRSIVTAAKKNSAKIPAVCGEVYHFNIEKGFDASQGGQYAILTEHTGDDFARTALPLEKKILVGNEPLYSKYIAPAIEKLKADPNRAKGL